MIKISHVLVLLLISNITLSAQSHVDTHEGVQIGGIKQWIGAVSDDESNPLLLFLHGGPGFSSRRYSKKFIKHLKKDFIVAQWDQRGSGITAAWNPSEDKVSLALMHADTKEVIDYLLTKFKKKKLYLVGFSWGGFLGHQYANQYPENLHAYISVSSMISGNESEQLTLETIRQRAIDTNNHIAVNELAAVNVPFKSWEELYYQRKWSAFFSDSRASKKTYPKRLFENWSSTWMPIFLEACSVNYAESVPALKCPVYFFMSEKDLVANHRVSQLYFDNLIADQKAIVWFQESTHEIPGEEPKKFSQELIKLVSSNEQ